MSTWAGSSEAAAAGLPEVATVDVEALDAEVLAGFVALEEAFWEACRADWGTATATAPHCLLGGHALRRLVTHTAEHIAVELTTGGTDPVRLVAAAGVLAKALTAAAQRGVSVHG